MSFELSEFHAGTHSVAVAHSSTVDDELHISPMPPSLYSPSLSPPDYQTAKDESDIPSPTSSIHRLDSERPDSRQPFLVVEQPLDIAHAKWYIGWQTILMMVVLFFIGMFTPSKTFQ